MDKNRIIGIRANSYDMDCYLNCYRIKIWNNMVDSTNNINNYNNVCISRGSIKMNSKKLVELQKKMKSW